MKKIPTLYERDESRRYVTDKVTPGCEWVLRGEGIATRKYDGTCVLYSPDDDGWYGRREVKPGKETPPNFVPTGTDEITGKVMGWIPMSQSDLHDQLLEALANWTYTLATGSTYELCGPKINGNPEGYEQHTLIRHDDAERYPAMNRPQSFDELRQVMQTLPWEGIVWHHLDGRMVKLKKRDFPRPATQEHT